jgi:hypothetical protein
VIDFGPETYPIMAGSNGTETIPIMPGSKAIETIPIMAGSHVTETIPTMPGSDAIETYPINSSPCPLINGAEGDEDAGSEPVTKANSPVWQGTQAYRGSIRTNGESGTARQYYQWDYTHNDIEVYNSRGVHIGSMDPRTGEVYKPAVAGRRLGL